MPPPRKIRATVIEKKQYGTVVALFKLRPEMRYRYRAGQFLQLAMDAYDPSFHWPESRAFSIANAPGNDHLELLVSQKGQFTERMIKELQVGDEVWLKLPFGDFHFDHTAKANAVFIAGGTGISPFIPYLEELIGKNVKVDSVSLYYGIREPELLIYDQLLLELCRTIDWFNLTLYVETGTVKLFPDHRSGLLNAREVVAQAKMLANPVYYLSGPRPMMDAFLYELQANDKPRSRIFYDKWE